MPRSSMSATRAERPAVCTSSTSDPPSTIAWIFTSGRWASRFSSTRSPLSSRTRRISLSVAFAALGGRFRRPAGRRDDDPVEPLRHEISPGHVADLLGRHLLNALDVSRVEQRIAGA